MAKDQEITQYMANVVITFDSQNRYGDIIDSGVVTLNKKITVNKLAGLGHLLAQIEVALEHVKEVNR